MILIDDVKYACIECIRGHRSSQCRHHSRPLLLVRSKGRPNVHANGNPNHRVAVFAQEVDIGSDTEDIAEGTPCRSKNNPVIIVKASSKQILDLSSGRVVGPYNERNGVPDSKPPAPIINSDSFVNTPSCCATRIKKPNQSCGCCGNKKSKSVDKSKILKKYLENHFSDRSLENGQDWTFVDQSSTAKVQVTHDELSEAAEEKFNVIPIPSCSVPGSCCCDDSCECVGCQVHGNTNQLTNEINKFITNELNLDAPNDAAQFDTPTVPGPLGMPAATSENSKHHQLVNNNTHIPMYPNGTVNVQEPSQNALLHSGFPSSEPSKVAYDSSLPFTEDVLTPQFTGKEPSSYPECVCPSDRCDCTNCETHGIINGMKLDDIFNSNFDPKLLGLIGDINTVPTNVTNPQNLPYQETHYSLEEPQKPRSCCSNTKAT